MINTERVTVPRMDEMHAAIQSLRDAGAADVRLSLDPSTDRFSVTVETADGGTLADSCAFDDLAKMVARLVAALSAR